MPGYHYVTKFFIHAHTHTHKLYSWQYRRHSTKPTSRAKFRTVCTYKNSTHRISPSNKRISCERKKKRSEREKALPHPKDKLSLFLACMCRTRSTALVPAAPPITARHVIFSTADQTKAFMQGTPEESKREREIVGHYCRRSIVQVDIYVRYHQTADLKMITHSHSIF